MASGPVVVASDHGGFSLKEFLKRHQKLEKKKVEKREAAEAGLEAAD